MQYKDGKIIPIIGEFSVLGNTYNLNGIDLTHAVFFVKEDRKKFRLLLPAEYEIKTEGANVNLVIKDGVLKYCNAVQVGIDLDKLSKKYNTTTPDIVILKDEYNQLVQDMENLWEYIKKQGITSDALNQDVVLPVLKTGETYVMSDSGLIAKPLVTVETELQNLLNELVSKSQDILNGYVEDLETNLENKVLSFLDTHKGDSLNIPEIRKEINYLAGTNYEETNVFGSSLKNIVKDNMYYYNNEPYMAKITASNSSGFLIPDTVNFSNITNRALNQKLTPQFYKRNETIPIWGATNVNFKITTIKNAGFIKVSISFISKTTRMTPVNDGVMISNFPPGFEPHPFEYSNSEFPVARDKGSPDPTNMLGAEITRVVLDAVGFKLYNGGNEGGFFNLRCEGLYLAKD